MKILTYMYMKVFSYLGCPIDCVRPLHNVDCPVSLSWCCELLSVERDKGRGSSKLVQLLFRVSGVSNTNTNNSQSLIAGLPTVSDLLLPWSGDGQAGPRSILRPSHPSAAAAAGQPSRYRAVHRPQPAGPNQGEGKAFPQVD